MQVCDVVTLWRHVNGTNEMAVALDYPAEWSDATWQPDEYILNGLDVFVAHGVVSDAQFAALQADPDYVVLASAAADLTAPQVDALKTKLASVYHSDVAALVVAETVKPAVITARMIEAAQRPPWRAGLDVTAGEVYTYERNLFEVVQSHRTQSDWTPDKVPALFKRFHEPTDDPWPWVQPLGAHDAYPVGARVLYNGATWVSTIPANVWAPGVTGWEREGGEPPTAEWAVGVSYKVGDRVMYQGAEYQCRQAHTSQAGWTPPAVPALWLPL